jgi:uncharacterized protein (TIGR02679 family)
MREAAVEGHPLVLTRRDVGRPLAFDVSTVFCCENPSVVHAAARRLRGRCPPLLCTNGRPHAAFWRLGEALVASGAHLRYHGDLDPVGVDIASAVIERLGATPWRMSVADYDAALRCVPEAHWRGGVVPRTPWDPELGRRILETGRVVYEEHVLDALLGDLDAASGTVDGSAVRLG